MPEIGVTNRVRRENFFKMLINPFLPKLPEASLDSKEWDHLNSPSIKDRQKGFIATIDDPSLVWAYNKLKTEHDRLIALTDIRIMLEEAAYIDGTCNKFITWSTVGQPKLTFNGGSEKKSEKIVNDMLDRIKYKQRRADYLYNGLFLECFLKKQLALSDGVYSSIQSGQSGINKLLREINKGMTLGRIEDILGPLPPETMFRNSNSQDNFNNPKQAFYQVDESEASPSIPIEYKRTKEWFHHMEILHPRWNHRRQKTHRYSRPALKPTRLAYQRTELSSTDAVLQRHLAASRLLVIYLRRHAATGDGIGVDEDKVKEYMSEFLMSYPTGLGKSGTTFVTTGANEIDSVGDANFTLSKPADIYMHFDFLSIGLLLHPVLAGFSGGEGGRISGPLLEQLRENLVMDIQVVNNWEDDEILLPLCYFELFLHGVFDTEISVCHELPAFLKNVERKIRMTEIGINACSRESYYKEFLEKQTGSDWQEERKKIEDELENLGQAKPEENINKGVSGSNKDSADTQIEGE